MPMVRHQGDPTITDQKETPIIFTTDGQPKTLSHVGARQVTVRVLWRPCFLLLGNWA